MFDFAIHWPDWSQAALRGALLAGIGLVWIILLVKVVGLRSFSKMTSFDFVMTVAMGSLLATIATVTQWSGFVQAMTAATALFAVQYLLARVRKASDSFESLIQNEPVLLMRDGVFIEAALTSTRVAKSDLIAKLREANVLELSKVRAAVLETTGDVSVMHGDVLEETLISGVRDCRDQKD